MRECLQITKIITMIAYLKRIEKNFWPHEYWKFEVGGSSLHGLFSEDKPYESPSHNLYFLTVVFTFFIAFVSFPSPKLHVELLLLLCIFNTKPFFYQTQKISTGVDVPRFNQQMFLQGICESICMVDDVLSHFQSAIEISFIFTISFSASWHMLIRSVSLWTSVSFFFDNVRINHFALPDYAFHQNFPSNALP